MTHVWIVLGTRWGVSEMRGGGRVVVGGQLGLKEHTDSFLRTRRLMNFIPCVQE